MDCLMLGYKECVYAAHDTCTHTHTHTHTRAHTRAHAHVHSCYLFESAVRRHRLILYPPTEMGGLQ